MDKIDKKKKITKKLETGITLTESMLSAAAKIAHDNSATVVLLFCDALPELEVLPNYFKTQKLILLAKKEEVFEESKKYTKFALLVPNIPLPRMAQMKFGITIALTAKYISAWDTIICLSGIAGSEVIDSVFVINMGEEQEIITSTVLNFQDEKIPHQVFGTVLNIALELAISGREGKPVGTIFVLGDTEEVMRFSTQMIINPFRGYTDDEKTIFKREMIDTIKEFAALDGAFIIDSKGVIQAAGRHLNAALGAGLIMPQGFGARHYAAAAITQVTHAITITVSETTGKVTIFRSGQILTQIDKPMPAP
jgi:DNA integrity scanning protein DisA with diadenylate cyclase activity